MAEYDYNGYTIVETPEGYYRVGDYEFTSYDEAADWIDEESAEPESEEQSTLHTYAFYYVDYDLDRCIEELVSAYSQADAELKLRRDYNVETILDCYLVD